jgi:hypothetical protein
MFITISGSEFPSVARFFGTSEYMNHHIPVLTITKRTHFIRFIAGETQMDDKFECRGKWFLLIIKALFRIVKFLARRLIYDAI